MFFLKLKVGHLIKNNTISNMTDIKLNGYLYDVTSVNAKFIKFEVSNKCFRYHGAGYVMKYINTVDDKREYSIVNYHNSSSTYKMYITDDYIITHDISGSFKTYRFVESDNLCKTIVDDSPKYSFPERYIKLKPVIPDDHSINYVIFSTPIGALRKGDNISVHTSRGISVCDITDISNSDSTIKFHGSNWPHKYDMKFIYDNSNILTLVIINSQLYEVIKDEVKHEYVKLTYESQ